MERDIINLDCLILKGDKPGLEDECFFLGRPPDRCYVSFGECIWCIYIQVYSICSCLPKWTKRKKQGNSLVLVVALEFQDYPIPPSHQATTQPNCVKIGETTKPKMAKSRKSRYKNIKKKPKESNQKKQENINGLL